MDAAQGSKQPSRLETDASRFTPSSSCMVLPDYMVGDVDLAERREVRDRRSNPCSEQDKPLVVRQPPATSQRANVYEMTSRPKGLFMMINNVNFESSKTREGAIKDGDDMMNLFRKLGYRVECYQDQTLQGMQARIEQFARRPELSRVDSIFVTIMSHGRGSRGRDTEIISQDDRHLECQLVIDKFNTMNCTRMMYKPKIFLFQLCRGELHDCNKAGAAGKEYNGTQHDGNEQSPPCRINDDVFVANATVQGFVAMRHRRWGSWFLQAICKVYSQHAREDDIETMHKKVDNLIKRCTADNLKNPAMQTSTYHSQGFNKKFYFYPGLYHERAYMVA